MYNLPFVPSERPLTRHISMIRNCLDLLELMYEDDKEGAFLEAGFVLQMLDSHQVCKELWEQLKQDAENMGIETNHPKMQTKTIDPYKYEYNYE